MVIMMANIQNKDILKSIPMLASILGSRYGVEVVIGGETAMTDGNTIYIPSLPLECDNDFIGLLRGYVDHEAAHIRYTDFELATKSRLTDFEKFVWNCIEDYWIEKKMASHFAGSEINFNWLIRHLFLNNKKIRKLELQEALATWLLLTLRSWQVPELESQVKVLTNQIDSSYPKLLTELGHILLEIKKDCASSKQALNYAKQFVAVIRNYIKLLEKGEQNGKAGSEKSDGKDLSPSRADNKGLSDDITSLQSLLDDNGTSLPDNLGELARALVESKREKSLNRINVALVGRKIHRQLQPNAVKKALRISTSLKARLQGLLQTQDLVRTLPSSHGKINKNRLHSLAVNDSKVFLRQTKNQATNTAVHILLDTSGSMRGKIDIANQACFALASALSNTKGINVGVTAFPALVPTKPRKYNGSGTNTLGRYAYVSPIMKHGEKAHQNFDLLAEGGTPLTEALWWLIPILLAQKEERKMILLLTDGEPDNRDSALHAIEYANKLGIEIYGIGIPPCNISDILPNSSIALDNIEQLPQTMFGILQTALLNKKN